MGNLRKNIIKNFVKSKNLTAYVPPLDLSLTKVNDGG